MTDHWNSWLDGLNLPLLRTSYCLHPQSPYPLVPPMLHVIHPLIIIPINGSSWKFIAPPTRATPTDSVTLVPPGTHTDIPAKEKEPKTRVTDSAISTITSARRSPAWSSTPRSAIPVIIPNTTCTCEPSKLHFFEGKYDPYERAESVLKSLVHERVLHSNVITLLVTRLRFGDKNVIKNRELVRTRQLRAHETTGRILWDVVSVCFEKPSAVIVWIADS